MRLLDLFSGIGGFSLAGAWCGWQTIACVEKDEFCQKVLRKNFPTVPIFEDVKTFDGKYFRDSADIVCGGFPCQPHSIAGKRGGRFDERFLWREMFRIIQDCQPKWVVIENVRGLLSDESGLVFEQVHLDLECAGYTVQPFIVPACAVDAPHKRDRIWIIAYANRFGRDNEQKENGQTLSDKKWLVSPAKLTRNIIKRGTVEYDSALADPNGERKLQQERRVGDIGRRIGNGNQQITSDTNGIGLSGQGKLGQPVYSESRSERQIDRAFDENQFKGNWLEIAAELCRENDGISAELDGTSGISAKPKNKKAAGRQHRLRALGSSIVPQIAFEIFKAIEYAENNCKTD